MHRCGGFGRAPAIEETVHSQMRYGISLIGDRVAPRCIFAESILVVALRDNRARAEGRIKLESNGLLDLAEILSQSRVDALICGGISREEREFLTARRLEVIDNVGGSLQELLDALQQGVLRSGFSQMAKPMPPAVSASAQGTAKSRAQAVGTPIDCLACHDRRCMQGQPCAAFEPGADSFVSLSDGTQRMLSVTLDIAGEEERILCRLTELIYFCLEMRYERIGVAYCVDLRDATEILVRVLRRFFKVHPVCCKIGGHALPGRFGLPGEEETPLERAVACNPQSQAEAINRMRTDLNVLVGLCMGADCIFVRHSKAPVTTLFVKDKSLANNPVASVYSGHHLKEAIQAAGGLAGNRSKER